MGQLAARANQSTVRKFRELARAALCSTRALEHAARRKLLGYGMNEAAPVGGHEADSSSEYLDRLMRRNCFEALWPLFAKATRPAKELTESYSALVHLRPFIRAGEECRVVHVGDGGHARTAAMFALKSKTQNVSVDPDLNLALVGEWCARFGVVGLERRKARIEDVAGELNAMPRVRTLVTFVHAHVGVEDVLAQLRWDAAFTLACCVPGKQLSRRYVEREGEDSNVLSAGRRYQVLVNQPST